MLAHTLQHMPKTSALSLAASCKPCAWSQTVVGLHGFTPNDWGSAGTHTAFQVMGLCQTLRAQWVGLPAGMIDAVNIDHH